MTLNAYDTNTWDNTGTNTGDPTRYETADSHAVESYLIPPYTSGNDDNAYLIPEQDTPDHDLSALALPVMPLDVFDEHLHRFFVEFAKDFDTYGRAIPLSGAAGQSAIAAGGPGVIYGFSFANYAVGATVAFTLYRGIDQTAIPIMWLNIPAAIDATHPGVLNFNVGTNGLGYPGLLSYSATGQFVGTIIVRHKDAL